MEPFSHSGNSFPFARRLPAALCVLGAMLFSCSSAWAATTSCAQDNSNITFQQTPALECGGTQACAAGQTGQITQAVINGSDPPCTLRPDVGQGITYSGMGGHTISGKCPPPIGGTDAAGNSNMPGTFSCQNYSAATGAGSNANIANMTNTWQQNILSGLTNVGLGITGALNASNALVHNQTSTVNGTNNLNVCSIPVSSLNGNLPSLPCGGALSLPTQAGQPTQPFTIGNNITVPSIPAPSTSGQTYEVGNMAGSGWCSDGTSLTGSTLSLPLASASLTLPPTLSSSAISTSLASPPVGSIFNIPSGNPVSLSVTTPGSMTLPAGGTFLGPDGTTIYTIAAYGTITVLGNGQVQLPNGVILYYTSYDPTQPIPPLSVNATQILVGTVTNTVSGNVTLNIGSSGTIMLPGGGILTGPNGNTYVVPQNGILTSLGGGQVQLPNNGTLLNYPAGTASVTVSAPSILAAASTSLTSDPSISLISPQTPDSTCASNP